MAIVFRILLLVFSTYFVFVESRVRIWPVTEPVQHGEGPLWNPKEGALYYSNTFEPGVYRWSSVDRKLTTIKLAGDSVGFLIPIKGVPQKYLLCHDRNIDLFSWDGKTNDTAKIEESLYLVDDTKPRNQFNDGKVDAKGRLWAGTLTRNDDLTVESNGGSLYLIRGDSSIAEEKLSSVSISNGLAWSADNESFYYIDSETRRVDKYNFDLESGNIEFSKTLFDLKDHPELQGIPDGMTIDDDDNLWVALFGGHGLVHVDSETGDILRVLKMPATYVTSATFGGQDYKTLFVTTSRLKLSEEEIQQEPLAGSLFAVTGLGVRGRPAHKFVLED